MRVVRVFDAQSEGARLVSSPGQEWVNFRSWQGAAQNLSDEGPAEEVAAAYLEAAETYLQEMREGGEGDGEVPDGVIVRVWDDGVIAAEASQEFGA